MAEVYVTLGEAAELERVKYNTMVKRVLRKQESFVTKTEKSETGGSVSVKHIVRNSFR